MVDYAFLHGGGQGSWVWSETIAALHRQADGQFGRALALDVPGCGEKRSRDVSELSPDDVAAELLADLEQAHLQDVILVGHSNAGTMLPRLAEKRPTLFRRLVYVSCCAPLPGQSVMQMMGSSQHGTKDDEVGFPLDPKVHSHKEQYPLMFCNDMSRTQTADFVGMLGRDTWPMSVMHATDHRYEHLAAVKSTYVVCLRDGILPVMWQERFAQRLKVERLAHIDSGHQAMNSRPNTLAEVLRYET